MKRKEVRHKDISKYEQGKSEHVFVKTYVKEALRNLKLTDKNGHPESYSQVIYRLIQRRDFDIIDGKLVTYDKIKAMDFELSMHDPEEID